MIKMLRRMLAEKANPDEYEWVLGCDIVKYLKLTSDLYFLGDLEQIKLFGLPVKVDFKEPNKMELRERKRKTLNEQRLAEGLEPVDFKESDKLGTNEEENYLKIINPGEDVNPCYGLELIELEPEHINALLEGKQLYTTINCGEYALIVKRRS